MFRLDLLCEKINTHKYDCLGTTLSITGYCVRAFHVRMMPIQHPSTTLSMPPTTLRGGFSTPSLPAIAAHAVEHQTRANTKRTASRR